MDSPLYLPGKYTEAAQKQLAKVWQQWNDMESAVKFYILISMLPGSSTSERQNEFGAEVTNTPGSFEATSEQAMRIYIEQQHHGITTEG